MGVNYNDYTAAVDRLRRVDSESRLSIYGNCESLQAEVRHDKALIYDAEHDHEPATVEWCKEIGFGHYAGVECPTYQLGSLRITDIDGDISFRHLNLSRLRKNPTRGDVLTALRLFGKKEGE